MTRIKNDVVGVADATSRLTADANKWSAAADDIEAKGKGLTGQLSGSFANSLTEFNVQMAQLTSEILAVVARVTEKINTGSDDIVALDNTLGSQMGS